MLNETDHYGMICHRNLGMPWGWCLKSLHQKVAVATISLKVVEEASQSKGNSWSLGLHPCLI